MDARKLRKGSLGVKLVSQFKFSIDFPPFENNPNEFDSHGYALTPLSQKILMIAN